MGPLSSRRHLDPFTRSAAQRVREDVERLTPAAPSLPMMVVSSSQASRAMTTHQALEEKKSINPPNRCQARDRRKSQKAGRIWSQPHYIPSDTMPTQFQALLNDLHLADTGDGEDSEEG
ncbi:hypothetical protein FOWG_05593 [Fusarium oxysporum f. sp. lycopersici MN25]|nr:hypothetical protein FOWG_05593 [Fusarium oxysporum f. sp. lycopersici MN25]